MKRTKAKFELILFFERFRFSPKEAFRRLGPQGYSRSTIYRYHQEWQECDSIVKTMQRSI